MLRLWVILVSKSQDLRLVHIQTGSVLSAWVKPLVAGGDTAAKAKLITSLICLDEGRDQSID